MILAVIYATFAVAKRKPKKIKACTGFDSNVRYRRAQGFEYRTSLIFFFQAFFSLVRNCKSCVYNCDDHLSFKVGLSK